MAAEYSLARCRDAHVINDLAMYNYNELKDLVNHWGYKLRKRLDLFLNRHLGAAWTPLYSMVTFTRTPYHRVVELRQQQDRVSGRGVEASSWSSDATESCHGMCRSLPEYHLIPGADALSTRRPGAGGRGRALAGPGPAEQSPDAAAPRPALLLPPP